MFNFREAHFNISDFTVSVVTLIQFNLWVNSRILLTDAYPFATITAGRIDP